jgi:transposase
MNTAYYVGLDVAQKKTAACVVDQDGKVVREKELKTHPAAIIAFLRKHFQSDVANIGLETGSLSPWLYRNLRQEGFPVVVLDSVHVSKALSMRRNKTDENDARGIAELVRMGVEWLGAVHVKSVACQEVRTRLTCRAVLVHQRVEMENTICGMLKPYGCVVERGHKCMATFRERVIDGLCLIEDRENILLKITVTPLLDMLAGIYKQIDAMDAELKAMAESHPVCRRFMSVPGVGPVTALAFFTAIEDPSRFKDPADVSAYLGLTPRTHQSGEYERQGRITKRGDVMTRLHLVQAATVMMTSTKSWSSLKSWGVRLSKRIGFNKAKVAVARKLAIVLFVMWRDGKDFEYGSTAKPTLAA